MSLSQQVVSGLCPELDVTDDTFKGHLAAAYGDDRFSDFTFRFAAGAEVLYGHRFILAARSPVMKHALSPGGEWASAGEIRLDEGVDAPTFGLLLKYMYTSSISTSYKCVHSLLLLAHRFQVRGLVEACEHYLTTNVSTDNIMMNLEVAEICGLAALKTKCLDKLQQPGVVQRILTADSLRKVALPGLRALLSLEPLPVDEYDLFVAVIRWATAQVGEEMPTAPAPLSREATELCSPLMDLVRFPTMNGKELSKHVKAFNVVPPARYIEALEHLADVDEDFPDGAASPRLARFRCRNPTSSHQTPRRRIATLTNEVTRLSGGTNAASIPPPAPVVQAPASPVATPPRVLPSVSQLTPSPWSQV